MCQSAVSSDRSLKDLREEGYKQRIFQGMMFCFASFPVYIQNISRRLKGIKGNAQWKQNLHSPQIHMKQGIQILYCKVCVFHKTKHSKIKYQPKDHKFPCGFVFPCCFHFFYGKRSQPGYKRGKQQKANSTSHCHFAGTR